MSKKLLCLLSLTLVLSAAVGVCSAATATFNVRATYDAQVANDGAQGPAASDAGTGTHVRDVDSRRRVTLASFDFSATKTPGTKFSNVTLSVRAANLGGTILVYGVIEDLDNISGALTWNTAPGVQNNPAPANNTAVVLDTADLVGPLMTFSGIVASQRTTSPVSKELADFMSTDTDGTITLLFAPPTGGNVILYSSVRYTGTDPGTFLAGEMVTADQYPSGPEPADKATDVSRDTNLGWTPGKYAATHDVYFGTVFEDVNTAGRDNPKGVLVSQAQDANTYDPAGHLAYGQKYYWRIDEVNAPPTSTIYKGEVWSFTVESEFYRVTGITASASSFETGKGPENTINSSGLDTADLHSTGTSGMWLTARDAAAPAWIQYDLARVYKLRQMWVWNYNMDFESLLGFGIKNAAIEYSTDAATWTKLGDLDFAQAASAAGYAHNTTVDFAGAAVRYVKITVNSGFGTSGQYGLSEVRFFYVPASASTPYPATGATGIAPDVTLGWRIGRDAVSHKVYLGADPNALTLADTVTVNSYAPAGLALGQTYYWRIDEVNTAEAISTWASDVWNFATSPYIAIDDMESYNDADGTSVFNIWLDGYGTNTNGCLVGYDSAANSTFNETTTIHGGRQSMPLRYDNTKQATTSEATRTFETAQDWTRNGVKSLTIFFYGDPNATGTASFWVQLADQNGKSAKIAFGAGAGEDATAVVDRAWTEWNMALTGFAGINLKTVKSMTLGVSGSAAGKLLIDDIRLSPTVNTPPAAPVLVGWWKLNNDAKDSSGNGNNGTLVGAPTWAAAGKIGAALSLNGTADYVDCGNGASLNIADKVSLSAWIKPATVGNSTHQDFVCKGDNSFSIKHHASNYIQFYVYSAAAYRNANSAVQTTAFNDAWHHVAGTFDGTQLKLYIDGQLVTSTVYAGAINVATYNVQIGHNSQQTTRFYNGLIDDVRIYQGALPKSEVLKLANP